MYETKDEQPTCVLVTLDTGKFDAQESLKELEELAKTAGAEVLAKMIQKRDTPNNATYIGKGKVEEVAQFCKNSSADMVIFDDELSGAQLKNIAEVTQTNVLDRTMLILDIFASRALSKEGKLQVELAQQQYRLPRLLGIGKNLSKQGGGIGSRGPGETKLETDRRYIKDRIYAIKEQIKEIEKTRNLHRERRSKDGITSVAIVGYTNVGKSTLLNKLTDAGVLCKDMLFATLDPTARALNLPDGRKVMLIDTVGLIRRLPHQLVKAFKSTLDEAANADLILNVCDISSDEMQNQIEVTNNLLEEIGAKDIPIVNVLSKCDKINDIPVTFDNKTAIISSTTGYGLDDLLVKISKNLTPTHKRVQILLPYSQGGLLAEIRNKGKVFSEEYVNDGIKIDALIDIKIYHKINGLISQ